MIIFLFAHWLADFVFQSDWMAKNKSKNNEALLIHVFTYTNVLTAFLIAFVPNNQLSWAVVSLFYFITFVTHFCTDYVTSRINTHLWNKGDVHNFFVSVGFDQLIHYVTIFGTLAYLKISF